MEDKLLDTDYFGNPSLYFSFLSFESVFSFDIISPFDQPVVPIDLSTLVSVEQGEYGKTRGDRPINNKPTPYSRSSGRSKR